MASMGGQRMCSFAVEQEVVTVLHVCVCVSGRY